MNNDLDLRKVIKPKSPEAIARQRKRTALIMAKHGKARPSKRALRAAHNLYAPNLDPTNKHS